MYSKLKVHQECTDLYYTIISLSLSLNKFGYGVKEVCGRKVKRNKIFHYLALKNKVE